MGAKDILIQNKSKNFLTSPRLTLVIKHFINNNKIILDIVAYGSYVKGKPKANDLDLAIILKEKKDLNFKLELAQKLKYSLSELISLNLDVKTIDLNDLTDPMFLARQGILGEGYSILNKKFISNLFGFECFVLFIYTLNGLTASQKKMFQYALNGRRGEKGLLDLKNAEHLGRGIVKVPVIYSDEFNSFFGMKNIPYKVQNALFYNYR